jgi:putative glycerol-1-phosphate prenyltransferase
MIAQVSKNIAAPLVVGGGINTPEKAINATRAGADLIVVGTAFEKDPQLVFEMSEAVHSVTQKVD